MKLIKVAQQDSKQQILSVAKYMIDIIKEAMSQGGDARQLKNSILAIAKSRGLKNRGRIYLPKEMDPEQKLSFKIYPKSADGKTSGEADDYNNISLYTQPLIDNSQNALQQIHGTLVHELSHIYEEFGTSPDEEMENSKERSVAYLCNNGEVNAHSWQFALSYSHLYPNQPFSVQNITQLTQQSKKAYMYLVQFASPEIQQSYAHIANLKQVHDSAVLKISQYVEYINQQSVEEVTANKNYKLLKVSNSKINLASKFKIIIASRSDYLKGLGASSDIISYIESLDDHGAQFLTNEFRKNPSLSLMELQSIEVPENRLAISQRETNAVSIFPEGMQKWMIKELRKLIRNLYNMHPNSGADYYSAFMGFAIQSRDDHGLVDWYNNVHPNLDSLSLSDAHAQSQEWHDAMASGGGGKIYMTRDIIYGPEWKDSSGVEFEDYNGWTIQEVNTENDLLVEGNLMNNCVGSYWSERNECIVGSDGGTNRIFSLRDPRNEPHVTIETESSDGVILQILGHSNSTPKREYKEMIKFWVESGESLLKSMSSNADELHYATQPTSSVSLDDYDLEVREFLHKDDEYGLEPSNTSEEIIDTILEKGLEQLILHNQRRQNFNFCLSDTLTEYVIGQGDEAIFYYLDKLQEYSAAAWDDLTYHDNNILSMPEREDFNSDEDFNEAAKAHEVLERDLQDEHILSAWNNCLHTDLIKRFKDVRGENLWAWHSKYQAEKERKKRYEEGSFNEYMKNSKPIKDEDRKNDLPNVIF
jgi:hypothetical protein